jgi:ABC-type multidrug transport system fused ATPase/permease subunit
MDKPVFRRLLGMLWPYRWPIAAALLLLFASIPCELFPAFIWQYVSDDIVFKSLHYSSGLAPLVSLGGRIHGAVHLLLAALTWLLVIYLAGELTGTVSTILLQRAAQHFTYSLRNTIYAKLQTQSLGYLQRQRLGDLMSRAIGDVDEVQSFIVGSIDQIIGDGTSWLATIGVVLWMDWRVACAALFPFLIVLVLLLFFNRKVKPIYLAARQRAGDVSTRLQENLSGITVIKIFNREKQEAERFRASTWDYYTQQLKAIYARNFYFPLGRVVGFTSNILMLGVGGYRALQGKFSPGKFIMFRAYWWKLFGPVLTLARVNDMVQRAEAAAKRVFQVLDAPDELPDAPDAVTLPKIRGQMELRNVSFRYPTDPGAPPQPIVVRNVDLRIEPDKTVALCGPSGGGKSTILNLLLRFYDPVEGTVVLDGRDVRSVHRDSFRSHFALVQQETFLFNDSVLDNIRYGRSDATMEQVIAAAKAANAHGFISRLPSGYDTHVGERGVRLSGGQKQRISIARAFLADPAILLLDEPTSSVEPDSEMAIIAALDRLMAGRTTVMTSHRPSLINQADIVYVIEDGAVTDTGTHAELIHRGGWFARFMRSIEQSEMMATDED